MSELRSAWIAHQSVPGVKALHATITPQCRVARSALGAFDEAVVRLRNEYLACQVKANEGADFHLILSVERPPLDGRSK